MTLQSSLALLVSALVVGCSVDAAQNAQKGEATASSTSNIVGGKKSGAAEDGVVLIVNGDESCSGSLIAPNLVLTARHCVAEPNNGPTECVDYGPTVDAGQMQFFVGADLNPSATQNLDPDAVGTAITVPTTSNMCGFDIALIQLDRDLTQAGAKIVPVRFSPLADNEPTIAVGYGVDGQNNERPARMQRATTVLGVGPKSINYATQNGDSVPYDIPKGDVVTGESTCYGDSGGPLLDQQGNLVAVTSRGIDAPDDGTHGNGCVDLPSVYAGARFNEQQIREAAKAAGHELPADPTATPTTPTTPTTPKSPKSPKTSTGSGDAPADGTDPATATHDGTTNDAAPAKSTSTSSSSSSSSSKSSGDDDDDDSSSKKKSSTSNAATPAASTGCSAASGQTRGDLAPALGLLFAIGALRRRRAGSRSSRSSVA
jgi:MYXO-CTERM domain-containing protein